jgi:hypothetical protein
MGYQVDVPLQSFSDFQAGGTALLPLRHPLMQLASPSEYIRITGRALLVPLSPLALGCQALLQGISDNSLRFGWGAFSLLSWTFALLQSFTWKQPVTERPRLPEDPRLLFHWNIARTEVRTLNRCWSSRF